MSSYSIFYHLVVSPGSEGTVDIFTIPPAKVFKVKHVQVQFPTGDADELEIQIRRGMVHVYPNTGNFVGDDTVWDVWSESTWEAGESITVYYKNNNTSYERVCNIFIEGEME